VISAILPEQIRGRFGAKLLLIMILLISMLSLLFNFFLLRMHRSEHHHQLANAGGAMARILAESITVDVFAEDLEGLRSTVDVFFKQDGVLGVAVFNLRNEQLYFQEKKEYAKESSDWGHLLKKVSTSPSVVFAEAEGVFVFHHPVSYSTSLEQVEDLYFRKTGQKLDVENIGYVAYALSSQQDNLMVGNVFSQTLFSTALFILFGGVLTFLVVRRMTAPLSSLLLKVRASTDIPDHGDDFDLLNKTFDVQVNELRETFTTISSLKKELEATNKELIADIARRKSIEATLRGRDNILAAVNHVTEKLLESSEWIPFIKEMVDELGEVLNVGAIRIFKHTIDASGDLVANLQYDWVAEETKANVDNLERTNLSYKKLGFESWLESLEKGEMVSGKSVDMPPSVKSWLNDHSVKSIALAPIMVDKSCWGLISLATFDRDQEWSEPELDALQTAARIIGAVLHRDHMLKDLAAKQAQLAHAGRLTAMGEMASGMAHEINQPLTVIELSADVCIAHLGPKSPCCPLVVEAAEDIRVQVKKVARIVDNMRIFSRQSLGERSLVNLAYPVLDALTFFRAQFRGNQILLIEEITESVPEVKTDGQKFEQIVVNFLSNARYAVDKRAEMEEGFRREIAVRLYMVSLSSDQLKSFGLKHEEFFGKQVIVFEVEDNGIGMSESVKDRCLEPFYTKKEVGEGTGLGLSITHSIVKELGLYLEIDSQENVGSLFRVIIPLQQSDHRV